MAALTSKLELEGFLGRTFYSQRSYVANYMLLAPIQSKIHVSKVSYFVPHYANEYAKEGEGQEYDNFHKMLWEVANDYE